LPPLPQDSVKQNPSSVLPLTGEKTSQGQDLNKINDKINPFGPKPVPEPDLTKIKPLQAEEDKQQPVANDQSKIDRGSVKVEVEGQQQDTRIKIEDSGTATSKQDDSVNKKTTYDDLFGN
jgi:hypothetical protein